MNGDEGARHLTVTGLANFAQDVVIGQHFARGGTTTGDNRDVLSATPELSPELLRACPHGTSNLAEQGKLYELCCARFGGVLTHGTDEEVGSNATAKAESSETSVAEHMPAVHNTVPTVNGSASEIAFRVNSDIFKRIVAYRAIHEPVPLWRLMQAQVKSLESLDRKMNDKSSKSTRVLLATMHAAVKWQRFRSPRHFSVASGLSNHPSLNAFPQIEVGQQSQLLDLDSISAMTGAEGINQGGRAIEDADIAGLDLSGGGTRSPAIQPKPKRLAIRRDSRRMSVDGYFSDDELESEEFSEHSRTGSTISDPDEGGKGESPESVLSRSSSPSIDRVSGRAGLAGANTKVKRGSSGKEMWGKVQNLLYKKATKMLWTVRCVDYLVMFGAGPPTQQSIRESKTPEDLEVEPMVFDSVPRAPGHPDMPVPPELATFCCPNGMKFRTFKNKSNGEPDILPPTHFAQVLAVGTVGTTVYCYCLHFYDKLEPLELLSMFAGQNRAAPETSIEKNANSPNGGVSGPASAVEFPCWLNLNNLNSNPVVYAPKCLVILSHWPFLTSFRRFLCQVLRIHRQTSQLLKSGMSAHSLLPVERYISNFIFDVPMPPRGKTRVQLSIADDTLSICRPPEYELPLCDLPIKPLFQCLSLPNIFTIIAYVLSERSIAVCSQHISLLAPALEALRLLIFPFHWQCTYIPILPQRWYEFLYSPVPFLMGLNVDFTSDDAHELHRMNGEVRLGLFGLWICEGLDFCSALRRGCAHQLTIHPILPPPPPPARPAHTHTQHHTPHTTHHTPHTLHITP